MNRFFAASTFSLALFASAFGAGCAAAQDSTDSASPELAAGVVQVVSTAAGDVLADARGLSLYTFDRDTEGESTCYNACAVTWPPFVVAPTETLPAGFGFTTREDGAQQVTMNGRPLYFYVGDAAMGDINGNGLGGVWHLAPSFAELPTER